MKASKKQALSRAGWKVGTVAEFLELSAQEQALVAIKLELVEGVRSLRERLELTQAELARRLGSSQSRIAKLEAGDRSISFDLLIRALLSLGANKKDIAVMIGAKPVTEASQRRKRAA